MHDELRWLDVIASISGKKIPEVVDCPRGGGVRYIIRCKNYRFLKSTLKSRKSSKVVVGIG
jgi:hypothetical protein